jgi:hypothetical protein
MHVFDVPALDWLGTKILTVANLSLVVRLLIAQRQRSSRSLDCPLAEDLGA